MRTLIFGGTGQDGLIMARRFAGLGREVIATGTSELRVGRARKLVPEIAWDVVDVRDEVSVATAIRRYSPTHIFNLAGISSVAGSWAHPRNFIDVNTLGLLNILQTLSASNNTECRVFQATSSEIFGNQSDLIDERTLPKPLSPYAVSKLASHELVRIYRQVSGLFVCSGVLFNHESPLRPKNFVSRRISHQVAEISMGLRDYLTIGDLTSTRDWGWAPEYITAMDMILRSNEPSDFVVATGMGHTVAEMVQQAFLAVGVADWKSLTTLDANFSRPNDVSSSIGNPSKIADSLGWKASLGLSEIMENMVNFDRALLSGVAEDIALNLAISNSEQLGPF